MSTADALGIVLAAVFAWAGAAKAVDRRATARSFRALGLPGATVLTTGVPMAELVLADQVAAVLQAETGSLGVRGQILQRWPSARQDGQVEVAGVPVRVKVGAGRVKVEHDDAARAARRTGLPLREVVSRAEEAWRRRVGGVPDGEAG